ncbi:MAG: polyprenyl synthetase family protein [Nanoarchaeota archaeon]
MNKFKCFLEGNVDLINQELKNTFLRLKDNFKFDLDNQINVSNLIFDDLYLLEEFVQRGGKRIRGILVLLSYKLFSDRKVLFQDLIKLAVITELNHAFLLIHDDIMDESLKRREKLTLHKTYECLAIKKKIKNSKMYGISKALVMGDTLNFISSKQIFYTGFDDRLKLQLIEKFQNVLLNTCYGQILDYELNYKDNITKEEILNVAKLKTSFYSIQVPIEIGFLVAKGNKKHLPLIQRYSECLGVAYQLQDDFLDYKIDDSSGKEIFKDIKEGKNTFIIYNALNTLKEENLKYLKYCLGNKNLTLDEGKKLVTLLKVNKVFKKNKEEIDNLIFNAINTIEKSKLNTIQKKYFIDFANFIMKRKY